MSKFKDGDLVTILTSHSAPKDTVGKIGKVISHEFGSYLVEVPDTAHANKKWYYSENQLGFPTNKLKADLKDLIKADLDKPKSNSGEFVVNEQGGIAVVNEKGGVKNFGGKPEPRLLFQSMPEAVLEVIKVLTYGSRKYSPDNWKLVDDFAYHDAFQRHYLAKCIGEQNDPDTNLNHLAHMACSVLFLLQKEIDRAKE